MPGWSGTDVTCLPPVAQSDGYTTDEDTPLTVLVSEGVLLNDSDINGDTLSAVLVDNVTNGTLNLAADGSFTYTPTINFNGEDSFTYKAFDIELYSDVVTVTITVNPVVFTLFLPIILR